MFERACIAKNDRSEEKISEEDEGGRKVPELAGGFACTARPRPIERDPDCDRCNRCSDR